MKLQIILPRLDTSISLPRKSSIGLDINTSTESLYSLERIYLDLRARCGEPTWYKQRSHPITCQPPLPTPQYSELLVEETEDHHEYDAQPPEAMGHLIAAHMESTPGEKNEPVIHLADDELCKAFEVVAAMQVSRPSPKIDISAN